MNDLNELLRAVDRIKTLAELDVEAPDPYALDARLGALDKRLKALEGDSVASALHEINNRLKVIQSGIRANDKRLEELERKLKSFGHNLNAR